MIYSDEEIRHMAISLLKLPTARDGQKRIGASNLSNGCNRCLAYNFLGNERSTPITDRAWMGRVLGTAFHGLLETRANALLDYDGLEGDSLALARRQAEVMAGLHPDAKPEHHTDIATLRGYGTFGGTIDLWLGDHLVDWKGSTRKRICILIDYLASSRGEPEIYGRKHAWVKLSEREYAAEMEKIAYKVHGYFGQATGYMHGSGSQRASLVFIARDGTGVFDNPEGARYDDPTAVHDVFVLSFDYDQAYAEALIARAQAIYDHVEQGGLPAELESHPMCFVCSSEAAEAAKEVDLELTFATA